MFLWALVLRVPLLNFVPATHPVGVLSTSSAARDAKDAPAMPAPLTKVSIRKTVKIGRPGYTVTKQLDPETGQKR